MKKNRNSNILFIRLSKEEKELINKAKQLAGYRSLSEFVRISLFQQIKQR